VLRILRKTRMVRLLALIRPTPPPADLRIEQFSAIYRLFHIGEPIRFELAETHPSEDTAAMLEH